MISIITVGMNHRILEALYGSSINRTIWDVTGEVRFCGEAYIGHGAKIAVGKHGVLTLGHDFNNTAGLQLICMKSVTIGQNVLISWDTLIMDTDFHYVKTMGQKDFPAMEKDIVISDDVWIGCRSTILKGAVVPLGSVVASGTVVTKAFEEPNTLIAGIPAAVKKHDIVWKYE